MRIWLGLLGGLLVWTGHFFGLYLLAEFGGDGIAPRLSAIGLTLGCLIALAGLTMWLRRQEPWVRNVGLAEVLIVAIAILWQSLPLALV